MPAHTAQHKHYQKVAGEIKRTLGLIDTAGREIAEILSIDPERCTEGQFRDACNRAIDVISGYKRMLDMQLKQIKRDYVYENPYKFMRVTKDMKFVMDDPEENMKYVGKTIPVYHTMATVNKMSEAQLNKEIRRISEINSPQCSLQPSQVENSQGSDIENFF